MRPAEARVWPVRCSLPGGTGLPSAQRIVPWQLSAMTRGRVSGSLASEGWGADWLQHRGWPGGGKQPRGIALRPPTLELFRSSLPCLPRWQAHLGSPARL